MYGFEVWAFSVKDQKALDSIYTRMLRIAKLINFELYDNLPRLTDKIRQRQTRHCVRHPDLPASDLVHLKPTCCR